MRSREEAAVTPTERLLRAARWLIAPALASCAATAPTPAPVPSPRPAPAPAPLAASAPVAPAAAPKPSGMPSPRPVRTHEELRRQAAERLVMANPERSYMTSAPSHLLT